jgi:hypothetical protein
VTKAGPLLFIFSLGPPTVAVAQDRTSTSVTPPISQALGQFTVQLPEACKGHDPDDVVVCGRSKRAYRIDPDVLAAIRAADAQPPKPPLETAMTDRCVGPNCDGATIPLVRMALTAVKAAALAAKGDDWREAFRTHPDQYQVYQQSKVANQRSGQ